MKYSHLHVRGVVQGICMNATAGLLLLAGAAGASRMGVNFSARVLVDENGELPQEEGAWKHGATRKIAYEEIGRCYDPGRDWSTGGGEGRVAPWEASLGRAARRARDLSGSMPRAQALTRSLDSLHRLVGGLAYLLPYHRAVGLTSQRRTQVPLGQHLADSHCFTFDYQGFMVGDPDPHGCGFFRRSFQPLQQLRQCIVDKLEADPVWQAYNVTANRIVAARRDGSRRVENTAVVDEEERVVAEASIDVAFDSIRRADEIIKSVGFKPWEAMTTGEAAKVVEAKISKTIITTSKTTVLKQETIQSIRTECFLVAGEASAALPERTATLKRALPCYQLMWDQVEVAGAPEQPMSNAITMWDRSLVEPGRVERDYDTPPVCARAAVALVAEKQMRAPGGYSATSCLTSAPRWRDCTAPTYFNCICFQYCWRRALERMCEIEPGCCWTAEQAERARALPRDWLFG